MLIAGLVALEVVLLAGPAFAVGARRRHRDLALVAADGGTPAQLRRIVLADGVVLGSLAAVGGIVARCGRRARRRGPGWRCTWSVPGPAATGCSRWRCVGIAGLAVVTGVLAALVPAFTAARQPVVAALAGRRGITRARRRWLLLGPGHGHARRRLVTAGGAQRSSDTVVLTGLILGELGLVLCTPGAGRADRPGRAAAPPRPPGSRCATPPVTGPPPRRRSRR